MKKGAKASPPAGISRALRGYLYGTAAVTGGAIMVVEILGARMLSPFIGTSHFVWTAQIAVTLVALACGYYLGGRLADRSQNLAWLYGSYLVAAVYLIATVPLCEPVAYRCLDFNLAVGSLLASTFLFLVPLALLAFTGPFLVRVITLNVSNLGGNVGRLTAIGTVGSFLGTMLVSYVMLPLLANSHAMYLTALMLVALSGIYFILFRRTARLTIAVSAILAVSIGLLYGRSEQHAHANATELFSGNSYFGELKVLAWNFDGTLLFTNDNLLQNTYDPVNRRGMSNFTYMLAGLARAYTPAVDDVLCIGLGVGLVPMDFATQGARVDVVEINPAVVPIAERFFHLDPAQLEITIDDGRHFLNRCHKRYDVVVLDAFLGDSSPSQLLTREAFQAIHRVLQPEGTLVINAFAHLDPGRDFFATSLQATLESVFPGIRIHNGDGQLFIVATKRPNPEFLHAPNLSRVPGSLRAQAAATYQNRITIAADNGQVLTDDFNPVEYYDASNREETRRQLAQWAQSM
jgi:spermidine synthase